MRKTVAFRARSVSDGCAEPVAHAPGSEVFCRVGRVFEAHRLAPLLALRACVAYEIRVRTN